MDTSVKDKEERDRRVSDCNACLNACDERERREISREGGETNPPRKEFQVIYVDIPSSRRWSIPLGAGYA